MPEYIANQYVSSCMKFTESRFLPWSCVGQYRVSPKSQAPLYPPYIDILSLESFQFLQVHDTLIEHSVKNTCGGWAEAMKQPTACLDMH